MVARFLQRNSSSLVTRRHHRNRGRQNRSFLEPLENRVLLSDFYWSGNAGANHNWGNASNWATSTGGIVTTAPGTGDNVFFRNTLAATVKMDADYSPDNLTVQGNSQVVFDFDSTNNWILSLPQESGDTFGQIKLVQVSTATSVTSLTFGTEAAGQAGRVTARDLKVVGAGPADLAKESAFVVNAGLTVTLIGDIDSQTAQFGLTDHSTSPRPTSTLKARPRHLTLRSTARSPRRRRCSSAEMAASRCTWEPMARPPLFPWATCVSRTPLGLSRILALRLR